jgi:hypothetical protein
LFLFVDGKRKENQIAQSQIATELWSLGVLCELPTETMHIHLYPCMDRNWTDVKLLY